MDYNIVLLCFSLRAVHDELLKMSTIEMSVDVCVSHDRSMLGGGGGGGGGLTMMQTRCGLDADYRTHPRENGALYVCVYVGACKAPALITNPM